MDQFQTPNGPPTISLTARVKSRRFGVRAAFLIIGIGLACSILTFGFAAQTYAAAVAAVARQPITAGNSSESEDQTTSSTTLDVTPEAPAVPYAMEASSSTDVSAPETSPDAEAVELPESSAIDAGEVLPAPDGSNRSVRIPILMYHYISDPPLGADDIRRDLSLPGPDFEQQLRFLVNQGYHSISMEDLVRHIQQGAALPDKPIVLSFDDGYKDAFTVAFPLLKKYGLTGTFFIFAKPINEENREYLSWQEVELMSAAGMEIGCHSYSHPDLTMQSDAVVKAEVSDAKAEIESHIHRPVLAFCYPAGAYENRTIQAVEDAGYWAAVTTKQGVEHSSADRLALRRIRVRGEAPLDSFAVALSGDW